MNNSVARSNKQTEVIFTTETTTYTDRIFGGGFGAYVKMFDRATLALTGEVRVSMIKTQIDPDTNSGTMTNRVTGEVVTFKYVEVK